MLVMEIKMEYLLLATNIATIFTAIAALLTVREMAKQRKLSVFPDFHFSDTVFTSKDVSTKDDPLHLELVNIGSKSAKNILLNWSFDIDKFISIINSLNNENVVDIQKIENSIFVEIKHNSIGASSIPNTHQVSINYFNPIDIQKVPTKVILPYTYLSLYNAFLYLKRMEFKKRKIINFSENPELKLRIEYYDLDDNKYENKFIIQPTLYLLGLEGRESTGSVKVSKVK